MEITETTPSASPELLAEPAAREKTCWHCGHTLITSARFCPHDGAKLIDISLNERDDPLIGQLLDGQYRILDRIGEGGMGMIYRASDERGGRFAIKVLKATYLRDELARRRFMHEARVVASLDHPNAVSLFDFGQLDDGSFFMVMELLHGESLSERLSKRFLSWRELFEVMIPICRVLARAHEDGVIHRDLKPENIYLAMSASGETPKLIDFGIAKQIDQQTLTHTSTIWGTPAYMSPEQARGARVKHTSDIYTMGLILYELISGTLPFQSDSHLGHAVKHMHEKPRALATLPGLTSLPPELDALILSMLNKEPSARPQALDEVADQLQAIYAQSLALDHSDTIPAQEIGPKGLLRWFKQQRAEPARPTGLSRLSARATRAGTSLFRTRSRRVAMFLLAAVSTLALSVLMHWLKPERPSRPVATAAVVESERVSAEAIRSAQEELLRATASEDAIAQGAFQAAQIAAQAQRQRPVVRRPATTPRPALRPLVTPLNIAPAPEDDDASADAAKPKTPDTVVREAIRNTF